MIELPSCSVCGGARLRTIGVRRATLEENPRNIVSAGTNVLLKDVLGLEFVEVRTKQCLTCTHVFLTPTFEEAEIDAFYGGETLLKTKRELRRMEAAGGPSWAQQHGLSEEKQTDELRRSKIARPESLLRLISEVVDPSDIRRICDIGGGTGELTSAMTWAERFVHDKNVSGITREGVEAVVTMEDLEQNGPYDLLVMAHVLEHIPHPVDFVRRFIPFLSSTGILYAEVPLEYPLYVAARKGRPLGGHVNLFTSHSFRRVMAEAGLKGLLLHRKAMVYYGELRMPAIQMIVDRGMNPRTQKRLLPHILQFLIDLSLTGSPYVRRRLRELTGSDRPPRSSPAARR